MVLTVIIFSILLIGCSKEAGMIWENQGYFIEDNVLIFPEPSGLINIDIDTLGEELPDNKDEGELDVYIKLTVGGAVYTGYGSIKVQGSSTAKWPKKNWSINIYSDKKREEKLDVKIGGSEVSNKWVAKAEWIDPTINRNALSYGLWEKMVESRGTTPKYEVDNAWIDSNDLMNGQQSAATGFPAYFPTLVKINEEHYGLSVLLSGRDPRNYNIDSNNETHIMLEFDGRGGYTDVKTWDKFSSTGIGQWVEGTVPKNEKFTSNQKKSIDNLSSLINGDDIEFLENFESQLDKTNIIDTLLFIEMTFDYDAVAQDIYMVTYDLEKWYFLPWDKDTTFGMSWDASGITERSLTTSVIDYSTQKDEQRIWYKTYHAYKEDVELRYKELRDNGVFSSNTILELSRDFNKFFTDDMWSNEIEKWDSRPGYDFTSTGQLMEWFEERLNFLDKQFNYVK